MRPKDIIAPLLAENGRAQAALLKLATYPRFHSWKQKHSGADAIDGGPREKRLRLFADVANKLGLLDAALTYYEFGVHRGASIEWWAANNGDPDSTFVGFDSFEGLPETWSAGRQCGHFNVDGAVPEIDDERVHFVKGWFHKTLPENLAGLIRSSRRVIHFDADLYRSTIYPLLMVGPLLRPDDVIIFDEFLDSTHEFRSFEDFVAIFGYEFDLISATRGFAQVAFLLRARPN